MKLRFGDRVKRSDADDPRSIPAYRDMRGTVTSLCCVYGPGYVTIEWDCDNGKPSHHRSEDLALVEDE